MNKRVNIVKISNKNCVEEERKEKDLVSYRNTRPLGRVARSTDVN